MTSTRRSAESLLVVAVLLASAMVAAWWWRATLGRGSRLELPRELWERVKEDYPLDDHTSSARLLPHELAQLVLRASPFDAQRRAIAPAAANALPAEDAGQPVPAGPAFAFKGRIQMGTRQRAILEDRRSHKTHFLEVGQEVAGFKVLDIAQDRVLLSDPQTNAEITVSLTASPEAGTSNRTP